MKRALWLGLLLALIVSGSRAATYATGWVDGRDADRVHLRAAPLAQAESLGLYFTGTLVEPHGGDENGWTPVTIGAQDGYMMTKYIAFTDEMDALRLRWGEVNTDAGNGAALYRAPEADALGRLEELQRVLVCGQTAQGWYDVELGGGERGYIRGEELTIRGTVEKHAPCLLEKHSGETAPGVLIEMELYDTGIRLSGSEGKLLEIRMAQDGRTLPCIRYICETVPDDAPHLRLDDVNMDGYRDIVALRTMGASDAYAVYFLYQPHGEYVRCLALGGFSAWRYGLEPDAKVIVNHRHISAGEAVRERWQWQDGGLVLLESEMVGP